MTFISYAQNLEDVVLWRALKHVSPGFYVDVGAQDPLVDSVSLAFYEHGWKGVHIEPTETYAQALRQARADEFVLQTGIADKSGTLSFFEVLETGLSTAVKKIADQHRANGFTVVETFIPTLTLTQALQPFVNRDIHWLKIDVEGFEKEVIQGWDASAIRPWVLIVEATTPMKQAIASAAWEPLVLERGYQLVYFDGLNKYFVASEHAELLDSFSVPPNVFDHFTLSGTSTAGFVSLLKHRAESAEQELSQVSAGLARLNERHQELAQDKEDLTRTNQRLQDQLTSLYASSSWRATAPFRIIATGTRSIRALLARAALAAKVRLKSQIGRVRVYLSARPALKSIMDHVRRRFLIAWVRMGGKARWRSKLDGRAEQRNARAVPDVRSYEDLTESGRRAYKLLLENCGTHDFQCATRTRANEEL